LPFRVPPRSHHAPLLVSSVLALAALAVAALCAHRVTALAQALHTDRARARRMGARAQEALALGAAAQRWLLAPAVLGGSGGAASFAGVSLDALGMANNPLRPTVRRTAWAEYRLIPVDRCATLDALAARAGTSSSGGLLVVGTGATRAESVATLVLGPLVQVALPEVPWAWIASLTPPAAPAEAAAEAPAPAPVEPVREITARVRRPRRAALRPMVPGCERVRRIAPVRRPDPHAAPGPARHALPSRDPPGRAPPSHAPP
jgi:hypothetical protein